MLFVPRSSTVFSDKHNCTCMLAFLCLRLYSSKGDKDFKNKLCEMFLKQLKSYKKCNAYILQLLSKFFEAMFLMTNRFKSKCCFEDDNWTYYPKHTFLRNFSLKIANEMGEKSTKLAPALLGVVQETNGTISRGLSTIKQRRRVCSSQSTFSVWLLPTGNLQKWCFCLKSSSLQFYGNRLV